VPATSSPWGGTAPSNPVTGGFTILVTNDDGISADGIDVMVNSLSKVPNAKIVVVAPATNKSGTSDTTTPGGAKGHDAATKGGVKGTAVDGYPADTVIYALDVLGLKPDLVVSGTNSGVNFGPFVPISGTIGAAREAARRGIPAIAVSGGTDDITSFKAAALLTIDEIAARRGVLGFGKNAARTVVSINVPNCAAGTRVRGIVDAPVSTAFTPGGEGPNMNFDCSSTAINPVDDVTALDIGFASRSIIPAEL
jgi:5'-nucleotidase